MVLLFFFLVLEAMSVQDIVGMVAVIITALVTIKSKTVKEFLSGSKEYIARLTRERDEATAEVKELKQENRILRRENTQRIEISLQEQATIRQLRGHDLPDE